MNYLAGCKAMNLNRKYILKEYGPSRVEDIHYFLNRLNKDYGFPYSEQTLLEMVIDFKGFTNSDFSASYKILNKMDFYGAMKMSNIRKACEEAKADRIRKEKLEEPLPVMKGCPMPDYIKKQIKESLS